MSVDNPSIVVVIKNETSDFTTNLTPMLSEVRAFQTPATNSVLNDAILNYTSSVGVTSSWDSGYDTPGQIVVTYVDNEQTPLPVDAFVRGLQHAIIACLNQPVAYPPSQDRLRVFISSQTAEHLRTCKREDNVSITEATRRLIGVGGHVLAAWRRGADILFRQDGKTERVKFTF